MLTAVLYAVTVLVWGTTWLAITFQLGTVPVTVSIVYRFALAGLVLFAVLGFSRKLQSMNVKDHAFTLLQGCCLFCFNFYCFYASMQYINSGLSSVVFSLATVCNCFFSWLIYQKKPSARVVAGSAVGVLGIIAMFWPELASDRDFSTVLRGVMLAVTGTVFFSLGNMISVRHQTNGLKPLTTNAWGMLYGIAVLSAVTLLQGETFTFDWRPQYIASLLYLAIPGSVVVFTTYLLLIMRIGADRAAYSTVMFPVVALSLSTIFEGYEWTALAGIGFVLVIAGNILIFARWPQFLKASVQS
ncbi:MAG: DMT family transporter [Endozoicomonas sp.]